MLDQQHHMLRWLTRFDPRSRTGRGNNGRSRQAKWCQDHKTLDHVKLLTVAAGRSHRARASILNSGRDQEFRQAQLYILNVIRHGADLVEADVRSAQDRNQQVTKELGSYFLSMSAPSSSIRRDLGPLARCGSLRA
jgi:hypothetical protein